MERDSWMSDAGFESGVRAEQLQAKLAPRKLRHAAIDVLVGVAAAGLIALVLAGLGYFTWPYAHWSQLDLFSRTPITQPDGFFGYALAGAFAIWTLFTAVFAVCVAAALCLLILRMIGKPITSAVRRACSTKK